MTDTQPAGMLQGLRVLEVTEPLGALVGRFLADLGADVIKIEPPQGDRGRRALPFIGEGDERLSLPFVRANVNKRSVMLDLGQRPDQERFRDLAGGADVVVSTDGIPTWAARGIDLNGLGTAYPRLVWLSISPFGLDGPHSGYLGNNIVAEAMGGLTYIPGRRRQTAVRVAVRAGRLPGQPARCIRRADGAMGAPGQRAGTAC